MAQNLTDKIQNSRLSCSVKEKALKLAAVLKPNDVYIKTILSPRGEVRFSWLVSDCAPTISYRGHDTDEGEDIVSIWFEGTQEYIEILGVKNFIKFWLKHYDEIWDYVDKSEAWVESMPTLECAR